VLYIKYNIIRKANKETQEACSVTYQNEVFIFKSEVFPVTIAISSQQSLSFVSQWCIKIHYER